MSERGRQLRIAGALAALSLTSGCTAHESDLASQSISSESSTAQAPRSETVRTATITPVLSVGASVTSNQEYAITAPITGVLVNAGPNRAVVTADDGSTSPILIPPESHLDRWVVPSGTQVQRGIPVAVAVFSGFSLHATVAPRQVLALRRGVEGARAEIDGGGAPFDCPLLDPRPSIDADGTATINCAVPAGVEAIGGLEGLVALHLPIASDVLSLPVEAVAGTVTNGSVFRAGTDGTVTEVQVELGASDGIRVEIRGGLREGDRVRVPSPSLIHG